jgi:hypothetical protein
MLPGGGDAAKPGDAQEPGMSRNASPEYHECVAFAEWLDLMRLPFSHIANETFTPHLGVRMKNKCMGVRRGLPDYVIWHPKGLLVFVEMKAKGAPPSAVKPEQRDWIDRLNAVKGVKAGVCRGFDEAVKFIMNAVK